MTATEPSQPLPQPSASREWEEMLASLRTRYPQASDGILFCVNKLQQDSSLTLRDFRDEARLHGLSVAGRSLHSAKVLLGLEAPAIRRAAAPKQLEQRNDAAPRRRPQRAASNDAPLEDRVIEAVRQIQGAATAQTHELRKAMQEAIRILQRALDQA